MKSFSTAEIAVILSGRMKGPGDLTVDHVIIDSRRFTDPAGGLFFAIRGERDDGHRYLGDLYSKGAAVFRGGNPSRRRGL